MIENKGLDILASNGREFVTPYGTRIIPVTVIGPLSSKQRSPTQNGSQSDRSSFWQFAKRAAHRSRKLGGSLTAYDIDELFVDQEFRCAVSGIALERPVGGSRGKRQAFGPSLDRIVAGGPYEAGNVRIVCNIVNFAMNEWGEVALHRLVAEMRAAK